MVKPKRAFVPERGDIVWLNFDPQSGHEQKGKRPALTISPSAYNSVTGLAIFCPITSKIKNYPFEVIVKDNKKISGAVLSDQVKCLDWRVRRAEFVVRASDFVIDEVCENLKALLMIE